MRMPEGVPSDSTLEPMLALHRPAVMHPVRERASEAELVEYVQRMADRDQSALRELYDATAPRVYSVALRFARDPQTAQEVVSDVFFQAWNDAGTYDVTRGRVMGWLLVCCRSRALDALRKGDRALRMGCDLDAAGDIFDWAVHEDLLETMERGSALREALETVTPLQRQLLSLSFFRGYSHSEIASREQMPLGSVKSQIRSALTGLRSILAEYR